MEHSDHFPGQTHYCVVISGQSPHHHHSHHTCVSLSLSGNHCEQIELLIIDSPKAPLILGHPWLLKHNPHVDWVNNSILAWSQSCHVSCLGAAFPAFSVSCVPQVDPSDLTGVPAEYCDLRADFSKSRATSLPPHRPYDCAIDLLQGSSP